jgi:hypothetical protein
VIDQLLSIGVFGVSMPIALVSPTAAELSWLAQGFLGYRMGTRRWRR